MRDPLCRVSCCLLSLGLGGLLSVTGCNQTNGYVMNESGKGFYAQGSFTAARREFERALMDSPENANYAFNVASAMRKQGDLIGAERMFRRALMLDPRHQPSHHEIAVLLREQGRVEEAEAHLQEWVATQPYLPEAHVEQAWMQREQGNLIAAERSLRTALQQKPNHATAMGQLGQIYQDAGRPREAQEMYQRSLARNPFQSELWARQSHLRGAAAMTLAPDLAAYPPAVMSSAGPVVPSAPMNTVAYSQRPPSGPSDSAAPMVNDSPWQMPRPVGSAPASRPAPRILSSTSMAPEAQPYLPSRSFTLTAPHVETTTGPEFPAVEPAHGPLTMTTTPIVTPF